MKPSEALQQAAEIVINENDFACIALQTACIRGQSDSWPVLYEKAMHYFAPMKPAWVSHGDVWFGGRDGKTGPNQRARCDALLAAAADAERDGQ